MPLTSHKAAKTNFSSETSEGPSNEISSICNAALICERLWNEHGRSAAVRFAMEKITLPNVREVLRAGDSLARTKALYVLSLFQPSVVLDDFTEILRFDDCPVVRHEAAYYLGTIHSKVAVDCLGESMLNDPDELVRHEAAEALGELGLSSGLPWLEQAADDKSPLVRRTVDIALKHIELKTRYHQFSEENSAVSMMRQ
jgi:HEAT repeat protein